MSFGKINWFRLIDLTRTILILLLLLGSSVLPPGNNTERVRAHTRNIEFDYIAWTLDAIFLKFSQFSLGTATYLPDETNAQLVLDYIDLIREIQLKENELATLYADPNVPDPEQSSTGLRGELAALYDHRAQLGPLAESILQTQLRSVLADMGLTLGGQAIPPILYHSTAIPHALIISPRSLIQQDHNISVSPDLTLDEQVGLENRVAEALDVSTLVVPIGGIGTYPTMVAQTSNLNWLTEVIAHEWIHNYFNLRPLGLNYLASPELRTMNETAASLAGKELGLALIARYYPAFLPPEPPPTPPPTEEPARTPTPEPEPTPPPFNFNAEMRETRINADKLLAEGKIEEAEQYMELRRQFLWDHGYRIRKLNQAYFAFYGAYADSPGGGAAGANPVGEAVQQLRAQSDTLKDFLEKIAWMASFEDLLDVVGE